MDKFIIIIFVILVLYFFYKYDLFNDLFNDMKILSKKIKNIMKKKTYDHFEDNNSKDILTEKKHHSHRHWSNSNRHWSNSNKKLNKNNNVKSCIESSFYDFTNNSNDSNSKESFFS